MGDLSFERTVFVHPDEAPVLLRDIEDIVGSEGYGFRIGPVPVHESSIMDVLPTVLSMVDDVLDHDATDPDRNDPDLLQRRNALSEWIDEMSKHAPCP